MKSVIEFCAIFFVVILNHIIGSFFRSKRPDYLKSFTVTENLLRYWTVSISAIAVVLLVAIDQPDGLSSIGLINQNSAKVNQNPFTVGIISISLLILVITGIQKAVNYLRKRTPEANIDTSNPAIAQVLQYQGVIERLAYLTVLPFIVISEDLVYRGYLVLMLGNKTHTFVPWAILSVILSVTIHLYQGRNITTIIQQAIFAILFIGLTISTGNILAPIIAHLYYNFLWTFMVWKKENKTTVQPTSKHSKSRSIAYSIFIGVNLLVLFFSLLLIGSVG